MTNVKDPGVIRPYHPFYSVAALTLPGLKISFVYKETLIYATAGYR